MAFINGIYMAGIEPDNLQAIADRINTGTENSDASRALVVFNLTNNPLSGVAVFHADMSWQAGKPLLPVVVRDKRGPVASRITDMSEGPDSRGRADRVRLVFDLRFRVQDVPSQGWRTYIAEYASQPAPEMLDELSPKMPGVVVVETLRHEGDLPPVGTFGECASFYGIVL